jgi:hypothetical protein
MAVLLVRRGAVRPGEAAAWSRWLAGSRDPDAACACSPAPPQVDWPDELHLLAQPLVTTPAAGMQGVWPSGGLSPAGAVLLAGAAAASRSRRPPHGDRSTDTVPPRLPAPCHAPLQAVLRPGSAVPRGGWARAWRTRLLKHCCSDDAVGGAGDTRPQVGALLCHGACDGGTCSQHAARPSPGE